MFIGNKYGEVDPVFRNYLPETNGRGRRVSDQRTAQPGLQRFIEATRVPSIQPPLDDPASHEPRDRQRGVLHRVVPRGVPVRTRPSGTGTNGTTTTISSGLDGDWLMPPSRLTTRWPRPARRGDDGRRWTPQAR